MMRGDPLSCIVRDAEAIARSQCPLPLLFLVLRGRSSRFGFVGGETAAAF